MRLSVEIDVLKYEYVNMPAPITSHQPHVVRSQHGPFSTEACATIHIVLQPPSAISSVRGLSRSDSPNVCLYVRALYCICHIYRHSQGDGHLRPAPGVHFTVERFLHSDANYTAVVVLAAVKFSPLSQLQSCYNPRIPHFGDALCSASSNGCNARHRVRK